MAGRDELVLELEDRVDAMKEFLMETLVKFGKRMKSMESKHNEEMVSVREEMRSLSFCSVKDTDSEEESESPKRRDRSTPKRTPTEESKKGKREHTFPFFQATSKKVKETVLPSKVHEIQDPIWKEKLKKHEWLILDKKEKLNQAQLAFVLHWFESNSPLTGKRDDAQKLLRAGELGGFWTRDWTPEGVSDFMSYLQDKIKGQNRKVRKMKEKEALSSELEDVLNSAMFDENK